MSSLKINHLAVWVCVILLFVLGFLWYGPIFGKPWMEMVGLSMAEVEANPPGAGHWITNAIATIVPVYVLAWVFQQLNVTSAVKGAGLGLLFGFAFIFLSDMTGNMFADRPYRLSWITGGFSMVSLAVAGLVLGAWTKKSS